uniref:DUF3668 domain-containing protein n=1 Tax=Macrostomum lignano TaxID=282301 RepID=A0A1I8HRH2_9PLAT
WAKNRGARAGDFIVKESFDKVSRYLITKTDFDNRFIWLDAFGSRIMGCAQCIEDKRYKRNAMHFNIGLVISMDCQVPVKYELIVRKLGRYFHSLEVETAFLSDPDAQTKLLPVLTSIRASLNGPGSCKLQVLPGRSLELFLKPAAPLEAAAMPQDFEVCLSALLIDCYLFKCHIITVYQLLVPVCH